MHQCVVVLEICIFGLFGFIKFGKRCLCVRLLTPEKIAGTGQKGSRVICDDRSTLVHPSYMPLDFDPSGVWRGHTKREDKSLPVRPNMQPYVLVEGRFLGFLEGCAA